MTAVKTKTPETKVRLELPDIAQKLKQLTLPDVDAVIGIATGGVAFATMVAFWLEKPLHLIHLNYRDENNKPRHAKPKLLEPFDINSTTFNKGFEVENPTNSFATKMTADFQPRIYPLVKPTDDSAKHILLVDDVSVSGATLETAKSLLPNCQITSLVIKGKADFVLYPDVHACILLPWRDS
jgi:uncharacterized protein